MKNNPRLSEIGSRVRQYLKLHLKGKKITYSQLAKKLDVSLITVKRWMTSQDISYENFIRICVILDLNPILVFDKARTIDSLGNQLSLEQEAYLAANPIHFFILTKSLMGFSSEEIQALIGYEPRRFYSAMMAMEKIGLILLLPKNKIRPKVRGPFFWRPNGTLETSYFPKLREVLFKYFRRNFNQTQHAPEGVASLFRPFEMYLTSSEAWQFASELSQVLLKYRDLSHRRKTSEKTKPFAGFLALDQFDAWKEVYLPGGKSSSTKIMLGSRPLSK